MIAAQHLTYGDLIAYQGQTYRVLDSEPRASYHDASRMRWFVNLARIDGRYRLPLDFIPSDEANHDYEDSESRAWDRTRLIPATRPLPAR